MLFDFQLISGAVLASAAGVTALILGIGMLMLGLPDEDRSFLDPIPPILKPLWLFVRLFTHYVSGNLPPRVLDRVDEKLQKTGACYVMGAEDFFSLCLTCGLGLMFIGGLVLASSGKIQWPMLILLAGLGGVLPFAWLKETQARRDKDIIKNLPTFLEYLAMCVEAGMNFSGALRQAVDKGPDGALKNEFKIILRDIRSGQTRADALSRMASRIGLKDVNTFVRAVIQAERMGSSMKDTLVIQSRQRLDERFQRAEKQAMEAPVKLIVPLIIFIFPLTFVILLFPIVVKFVDGN